jgi:hypothetical protein
MHTSKTSGWELQKRYLRLKLSSDRCRDYPDEDYDSLVAPLAFRRDAGIIRRFLTFCIFKRHQHLETDTRKYRYPGSRQNPLFRRTYQREKAIPVPQTFYFLHPAACVSGRFMECWLDRI